MVYVVLSQGFSFYFTLVMNFCLVHDACAAALGETGFHVILMTVTVAVPMGITMAMSITMALHIHLRTMVGLRHHDLIKLGTMTPWNMLGKCTFRLLVIIANIYRAILNRHLGLVAGGMCMTMTMALFHRCVLAWVHSRYIIRCPFWLSFINVLCILSFLYMCLQMKMVIGCCFLFLPKSFVLLEILNSSLILGFFKQKRYWPMLSLTRSTNTFDVFEPLFLDLSLIFLIVRLH